VTEKELKSFEMRRLNFTRKRFVVYTELNI